MSDDDIHLYEPSKWRLTLQQLLNGDLDYAARDLGGIEPFVERQLAGAVQRTRAEAAFGQALNDEVVSWQVGRSTSAYYVVGIVQLIGAFTPPAGFGKCAQIIEGALDSHRVQLDHESSQTIRVTAFAALGRYYPTAPPKAETDNAYTRYQAILRRLTVDSMLAPLAIRERLRLGLLHLDEPSFIADAIKSEAIMRVLFDYAVSEPDPWSIEQLTKLFNACVATNLPEALKGFLERVRSYGVTLIAHRDYVSITRSDGVKLLIRVQPELVATYLPLRWRHGVPEGYRLWLEAE